MEDTVNIRFFDASTITTLPHRAGYIGMGSFGVVYKCYVPACRVVAVKVVAVNPRSLADNIRKEGIREAEIAMQANHENIARLHGVVRLENAIGLVIEFMPNGTLESLIGKHSLSLGWPFQLRVGYELACGLAYLHNMITGNKNTIHGDIKPGNILLDKDMHVKITDFGSSTMASVTSTFKNIPKTNPQYTPIYAAPEVMKDPFYKALPSCDVYSYAMTVYHLIFREVPVGRMVNDVVMFRDRVAEGHRPSTSNIKHILESCSDEDRVIAENLLKVVKKCWQTEPNERLTSEKIREKLFTKYAKVSEADVFNNIITIKKYLPEIKHDDVKGWIQLQDSLNNPNPEPFAKTVQPQDPDSPKADEQPLIDFRTRQKAQFNKMLESLENCLHNQKTDKMSKKLDEMNNFIKSAKISDTAKKLQQFGDAFFAKHEHLKAVFAFRSISKYVRNEPSALNEDTFEMMQTSAQKIHSVSSVLQKPNSTISTFLTSSIESVIEDLNQIQGDFTKINVCVAWCYRYLCETHIIFNHKVKAFEASTTGMECLRNIGIQAAMRCKVYCYLQYLTATLILDTGDVPRARSTIAMAITGREYVSDWASEEEKKEFSEKIRETSRNVRLREREGPDAPCEVQ